MKGIIWPPENLTYELARTVTKGLLGLQRSMSILHTVDAADDQKSKALTL